ncbi:MAG: LamB/YcsF family protein [Deltaproteobacteria bacterium]|nr:MAG: LamB/YcsF family protein [Deltaproteobacteria bacterium]RTZ98457.1 MAG: LamB/YcsF family protein [Deltaproteobacteria bacterium]
MKQIDLNSDIGESFGAYTIGQDAAVLAHISSANIACGWHAGDPMVMDKTVQLAVENGVGIGAHPGYPDLMGFGRRQMNCSLEEIRAYLVYQVGALMGFCAAHDVRLQHVKPHGALYNTTVKNDDMVRVIADAIAAIDPSLYYVALAGARAETIGRICHQAGIRVIFEAFPDRAYTPQGELAPRHLPGAVIRDPAEAAQRAARMAVEGAVIATDGSILALNAQTLCVHGDTPEAVALVRQIRQTLKQERVAVRPMLPGKTEKTAP